MKAIVDRPECDCKYAVGIMGLHFLSGLLGGRSRVKPKRRAVGEEAPGHG